MWDATQLLKGQMNPCQSFQAVRELYHSGDCDIPVSAIISAAGMFQSA